jgi:TatD DNase family protein
LVDTHCHLDLPAYSEDLGDVIKRASDEHIGRVIVPGIDVRSSIRAVDLAGKYESVFAAVGIHPHSADEAGTEDIETIRRLITENDKVVAVGEIGLDGYKGYSSMRAQRDLFRKMLIMARQTDLPVILHNRQADEIFLDIISGEAPYKAGGVAHCFSSGDDVMRKLLSFGFHVSFTGCITFRNAGDLRERACRAPLDRLLLETDGPYMSPEPVRGKRNEPANLKFLARVLSEAHSLSPRDIARITSHNANRLFRLGISEKPAVAYPIRDSLYLNITNRCTNRCSFCVRDTSDFVMGHNLRLDREPTSAEVKALLQDIDPYKEIVFCGYGEPTLRLGLVKEVASFVKSKGGKVRLTTNGQGNLINGRDILPELKGIVDKVSISLNSPDSERYEDLCRSVFGKNAFEEVKDFMSGCGKNGIQVVVTCLDMIGEDGIRRCGEIANEAGAVFRLRHLDAVG